MMQLECKNLDLGYKGKVVQENLNLQVEAGDYFLIVGGNGSGKTTLMKTLLGLQQPLGGHVLWNKTLKKQGIGYLPQQTEIQKEFPASVEEIVLSGCLNQCGLRPYYRKKDREKMEENLKRTRISHLKKRRYSQLSGGQQQRVLLARALCSTENILFLDEPDGSLDIQGTKEMYEIIDDLNREKGITIIAISHDIKMAKTYATKVLSMEER